MVDSTTPQTDEMKAVTYYVDDPKGNLHLGSNRPVIFKIPIYLIGTDRYGRNYNFKENSVDDIAAYKSEKEILKLTTSQPLENDFLAMYDIIKGYGFSQVIGMFISDRMSGTTNAAAEAANKYRGLKMKIVDTKTGSLELGVTIDKMLDHSKEGFNRMIEVGKQAAKKVRIYFSVTDLQHLVDSGRMSGGERVVSSLLKIMPIISVGKDIKSEKTYGKMYPYELVGAANITRTLPKLIKNAQYTIEKENKSDIGFAYVMNIRLPEVANDLYSRLDQLPMFEGNVKSVKDDNNAMWVHVGPAVALAVLPVDYVNK